MRPPSFVSKPARRPAPRRLSRLLASGLALLALGGWYLWPALAPTPPAEPGSVTAASASAPASAADYALKGRVVRVADGDTVTLLVGTAQRRIRLASIDAPETGDGRARPGQPYGQAAGKALTAMVAGQTLAARCYEQDTYGRDICDLMLADGQTANRRMVEQGMAWANRQGRDRHLRDRSLIALEQRAREARLGLWADRQPVPPWQWRYDCWRQGQC